MIPAQVPVLGFIKLITKMDMMDTLTPLIIPSIAAPAVFFYMKQYIESIVPLEIVEAARVDGRITSYNVCYTKLLRAQVWKLSPGVSLKQFKFKQSFQSALPIKGSP